LLPAASRVKLRKAFDFRVELGTGLVFVLGLLVVIQLFARG
jgi:hypothetical protein